MTAQLDALTSQQIEAVRLVFQGESQREVARRLEVTESMVRRWAAKPGWQVYLDELRTTAEATGIKAAVATLGKASSKAAAELVELLRDEKAEVRLRAAEAILSRTGIGEHLFNHNEDADTRPADELEAAILERADEIRKRRGTG